MNKYTRSMDKLSACIQDILNANDLSIDTKSILLVLAATMSSKKLKAFLAPLSALNTIYASLVPINAIRTVKGPKIRDYVILATLQAVPHNVNSDELQSIIRHAASSSVLPPALSKSQMVIDLDVESKMQTPEFALAKQKTMQYLLKNFEFDNKNQLNILIDAYLQNRLQQDPTVAYNTLAHAMTDILLDSGFDLNYSKLHSSKIINHALNEFLHDEHSSPRILHAYMSCLSG